MMMYFVGFAGPHVDLLQNSGPRGYPPIYVQNNSQVHVCMCVSFGRKFAGPHPAIVLLWVC